VGVADVLSLGPQQGEPVPGASDALAHAGDAPESKRQGLALGCHDGELRIPQDEEIELLPRGSMAREVERLDEELGATVAVDIGRADGAGIAEIGARVELLVAGLARHRQPHVPRAGPEVRTDPSVEGQRVGRPVSVGVAGDLGGTTRVGRKSLELERLALTPVGEVGG
jgi:hypothetical protein